MPTPLGDFHQPDALLDRKGFDEKYERAIRYARDGLPAKDICMMLFGVSLRQYTNWVKWVEEDLEAGFDETESNLIKLILGIAKEDAKLHKRLSKTAIEMAIDDKNSQMLQFLLKTRYGYTEKTKSELEVSSKEEAPIKFEIVDMQPNDEE